MKHPRFANTPARSLGSLRALAAVGTLPLAFFTASAQAASDTWQGATGIQAWNDSANWVGGNIPGSTSETNTVDDATFDGATGGASLITIDAGRNVRRLIFTSTSTSYTIGSAGPNGGNALLLSNNSSLGILSNISGAAAQTINAPLRLQGTVVNLWSDSATSTGTITVNGDISNAGSDALTLNLRGRNTGANTVAGVLSDGVNGGTLSISKQGQNTSVWTLGGTNTYTGSTTVTGGTLRAGSSQAFGINSAVVLGAAGGSVTAALNLDGHHNTVGSIKTADGALSKGTVLLGAATLTLAGTNATAVDFGGVISGVGSLVKNGAGVQSLSGANTHTGGTTVNAGTLLLASAGALEAATGDLIVTGGSLTSTVSNTVIGGHLILDGGTLAANAANTGTLTLAANRDFSMSAGTLQLTFADISSFDQIVAGGVGSTFSIDGGIIDLTGSITDYGASYQIFSGFESGSIGSSSLSFINYDDAHWAPSLDDGGLLTFAAVPEPATWGVFALSSVFAFAATRRRARPQVSV